MKCTRYLLTLLCFLTMLVSCRQAAPPADLPTFRIGYMICNSEEETMGRFAPLTVFLSKKMGVRFEGVAIDTTDFLKHLDSLDFTHTNSLLYIMMNRYHGVETLALEKMGSMGARSKGVVATLKKSKIKTLADLKDKTMIFGPMLAPTAYMSQIYTMELQGFHPDDDLRFYTIPTGSYKHEKVIYSVLFEKYDAGAFPYYDYETMILDGKINPDDFTIIAEGPEIPYCNFAVTQKVDEKMAALFRKTLLAITEEDTAEINGQVVKVLKSARIKGYEAVSDADFDIVREMAQKTNMPPYQKF